MTRFPRSSTRLIAAALIAASLASIPATSQAQTSPSAPRSAVLTTYDSTYPGVDVQWAFAWPVRVGESAGVRETPDGGIAWSSVSVVPPAGGDFTAGLTSADVEWSGWTRDPVRRAVGVPVVRLFGTVGRVWCGGPVPRVDRRAGSVRVDRLQRDTAGRIVDLDMSVTYPCESRERRYRFVFGDPPAYAAISLDVRMPDASNPSIGVSVYNTGTRPVNVSGASVTGQLGGWRFGTTIQGCPDVLASRQRCSGRVDAERGTGRLSAVVRVTATAADGVDTATDQRWLTDGEAPVLRGITSATAISGPRATLVQVTTTGGSPSSRSQVVRRAPGGTWVVVGSAVQGGPFVDRAGGTDRRFQYAVQQVSVSDFLDHLRDGVVDPTSRRAARALVDTRVPTVWTGSRRSGASLVGQVWTHDRFGVRSVELRTRTRDLRTGRISFATVRIVDPPIQPEPNDFTRTAARGQLVCVQARAIDTVGNVSVWKAVGCVQRR